MADTASSPLASLIRRSLDDPRLRSCSDQELLGRFLAEQDEAAFEAVLRRHGPMVLDVCRGVLGNEADAEDAFQATFLVLAHRAASIRNGASLASWLHGVAYRVARKARAESARRAGHEDRASRDRPVAASADDLTWREVRQVVHEELSRLSDRYRSPLVLCYLEGKTQDEAARQLRLPKGTLKGYLERGRALLRGRLVRRGFGAAGLVVAAWPAAAHGAGVPASLISSTLKAAAVVAARGVVTAAASVHVAALTEGVLKAMFMTKLKAACAALAAAAVLAGGAFSFPFGGPGGNAALAGDPPTGEEKPAEGREAKPVIEVHWDGGLRHANAFYRFTVGGDGAWDFEESRPDPTGRATKRGKLSADELTRWVKDIEDGGFYQHESDVFEGGETLLAVTVRVKDEQVTKAFRPEAKMAEAITKKVGELVRGEATVELTVVEAERLRTGRSTRGDESEPLVLVARAAGAGGDSVHVDVSREVATRLKRLGIEDPAEHFRGKVVRVRGTVERLTRRPGPASRIEVTNLDQFEVIRKP